MKKIDHSYQETRNTVKSLEAQVSRSSAEVDETIIWKKFQQGDEESLVYVYKTYVDKLYTYGGQFCRQGHLLEDYIQELFFELIDKRSRLSKVHSIKGYLFASLKRKILRELKRNNKEELIEDAFFFTYEKQTIPILEDLKEEDFKLVFQKVNQLPVSQREIIFLFFYEGMKYSEIASVLDIKVETARKHMYRALKQLRDDIGTQRTDFQLIAILLNLSVVV